MLSSFSTDILGYDQVWYVMVNDIKECILSANTNCTSLYIFGPEQQMYHGTQSRILSYCYLQVVKLINQLKRVQ